MAKKGGLGKGLGGGDAPKSLRAQIKAEQDALLAAQKAKMGKQPGTKPKGGLGKGLPPPPPRKPPPPPSRNIDEFRRKRKYHITSNVELARGWKTHIFSNPEVEEVIAYIRSLPRNTWTFGTAEGIMAIDTDQRHNIYKAENLYDTSLVQKVKSDSIRTRWEAWRNVDRVYIHTKTTTPPNQVQRGYRQDLPF